MYHAYRYGGTCLYFIMYHAYRYGGQFCVTVLFTLAHQSVLLQCFQ